MIMIMIIIVLCLYLYVSYDYIDLLVSEQKAEWGVLSVRMDSGYH